MTAHLFRRELSVVIPTHLPRHLERSLLGLSRQTEPSFEVIVVENGARSDTVGALCGRWRDRLNLRYEFDPVPGLNRARNTGARMAGGRYVALLDDDCEPVEDWVESMLSGDAAFPDAAAVGGPIRLEFESRPPDWLVGEFRTCLSELDRGPAMRKLDEGDWPFGANMAFRKSVFEAAGGFPEGLGMNTRRPPQLANDEVAFLEEASRVSGSMPVYCPKMSVRHVIPAARISLNRMFQRRFGQGVSDVALLRWRYGADPGKLLRRYVSAVFPHQWHFEQFQARIRELEPETAGQYLHNHVVCRTGYLWGYRQAMSEMEGFRSPGLNGDTEPRATASRMTELMYCGNGADPAPQTIGRADNRLQRLISMARVLEPGLFEKPLIETREIGCG